MKINEIHDVDFVALESLISKFFFYFFKCPIKFYVKLKHMLTFTGSLSTTEYKILLKKKINTSTSNWKGKLSNWKSKMDNNVI